MIIDVNSTEEDSSLLQTLRTIRSTDPRFTWIAREFGEEPDRRMDLATLIDEQFVDLPDGDQQRYELLLHLNAMIQDMRSLNPVEEIFDIVVPFNAMIQDMRSLNPVEEIFDIVVPFVSEPHRLSVLLRRMGWSGEYWYTEQEAAYALKASISQVRNERAKLVRALRRGPVWAPVLHRCAAVVQELAPVTQTQFKVICGIDLDGTMSMNLWGFLSALDIFGIDHWFHLENSRTEPTVYSDSFVDFGYPQDVLDKLVGAADRQIAREMKRQRRLRREERLERQRYIDPWEIRELPKSRRTDVGARESSRIHWWEIPHNSALRTSPTYDRSLYGGPLITSRTLVVQDQIIADVVDAEHYDLNNDVGDVAESVEEQATGSVVQVIDLFAGQGFESSDSLGETELLISPGEDYLSELSDPDHPFEESELVGVRAGSEAIDSLDQLDTSSNPTIIPVANEDDEAEPDCEIDLVDLADYMQEGFIGLFTGLIDQESLLKIESNNQDLTAIIDRASGECVGVVRTSRLRNKLISGIPEIRADDSKLRGIELGRFISESEFEDAFSRSGVVYFNDGPGVWGVVFRQDA